MAGVSYLLNSAVEKSRGNFNPALHISRQALKLVPGSWPIFVGLSYGDAIAASVIAQTYNDEIRVFASFVTEGMSLRRHLEEYTKSWLIAHAHKVQLFGGYEDITDTQLKSEIFVTASEVLQGQWAGISKPWETRRDAMLDMLTKAVPFIFRPLVQFDPQGTVSLSQALSTGRYNEKLQVEKKSYHVVNAFTLLITRLEYYKAMPKPKPMHLPTSAWSV